MKGHIVIVIAEGAFDGLVTEEQSKIRAELGILEDAKDDSGNIKTIDLADYIKKDIAKYAKAHHAMPV